MSDQPPQFKPGDKIDKYTVVRALGCGGMGAVYLVEHPILQRQSAIKIPYPAQRENEGLKTRLFREADFLAKAKHPSIVALHDVGEHDGLPFLAMDIVQGKVLGTMVDEEEPVLVIGAMLGMDGCVPVEPLPGEGSHAVGLGAGDHRAGLLC